MPNDHRLVERVLELEQEISAIRARLCAAVEILRRVQWNSNEYDDGARCCVACGGLAPGEVGNKEDAHPGHTDTCSIAAALASG